MSLFSRGIDVVEYVFSRKNRGNMRDFQQSKCFSGIVWVFLFLIVGMLAMRMDRDRRFAKQPKVVKVAQVQEKSDDGWEVVPARPVKDK